MKTFPDPIQKSQPPTPELLAQFAAQSRAAADEMQKQGIPLPTKPDAIQEPQPVTLIQSTCTVHCTIY